jgi:WD40 repeat protein
MHEVRSANFSPDGKQIVSASVKVCRQLPAKSQSLRLLSPEAETICLPSGLKFELWTTLVCPGKQIISASIDNSLKLWDLTGNCLQTFTGHTSVVQSANFSLDGKKIVSASGYGSLKLLNPKVWDYHPLKQRQSVCHLGWNLHSKPHLYALRSANFSPDGKQIISASWDCSLKLWDLAGNCLQTFTGHTC